MGLLAACWRRYPYSLSFGDIDTNALNEWTAARVGNEVVFTAPASNPLNLRRCAPSTAIPWNSVVAPT